MVKMVDEKLVKYKGGCYCGKVWFEVMVLVIFYVYDCK